MFDFRTVGSHSYAIVDPLATESLPPTWPLVPLVPAALAADAHLLPALLPLGNLDPNSRRDLLHNIETACSAGEAPSVTCFLETAATPGEIRLHCTQRLVVHLTGTQRALLRYFDPRVLSQLAWMLEPRQMCWLLGPISRVTFWLRGEWAEMVSDGARTYATPRFDSAQSARVLRIGAINAVLSRLGSPVGHKDLYGVSSQIDDLLARAEAVHCFGREVDRIEFALHGLNCHPRFDAHPRIQALIAQMVVDESTYQDASALLESDDWRRIAEELDNESHKGAARA